MNYVKPKEPKVSIIIPSFNTGHYLRFTLASIMSQTSKDYEIIVVDGASTDETLEMLNDYPNIKVISEPDNGYTDALTKGLKIAQGKYVMQCCVSDGLLDQTWIEEGVKILDSDKDVSLVWGLVSSMSEDGNKLVKISLPLFEGTHPPQKEEYFYYWLATGKIFPEGNQIVRKDIFKKFLPPDAIQKGSVDPILEFNYRFNTSGYLSYFLNKNASFGREHSDSLTSVLDNDNWGKIRAKTYKNELTSYRKKILFNSTFHCFRDGNGNPLNINFSRRRFIIGELIAPKEILKRAISLPKPLLKRVIYFLLKKNIVSKNFVNNLKEKSRILRFFCGPYW